MLLSFKFGGGKDFDEIVIMYCPTVALAGITLFAKQILCRGINFVITLQAQNHCRSSAIPTNMSLIRNATLE
jgi:hypothetical protein